jgi:hypothetical protein
MKVGACPCPGDNHQYGQQERPLGPHQVRSFGCEDLEAMREASIVRFLISYEAVSELPQFGCASAQPGSLMNSTRVLAAMADCIF